MRRQSATFLTSSTRREASLCESKLSRYLRVLRPIQPKIRARFLALNHWFSKHNKVCFSTLSVSAASRPEKRRNRSLFLAIFMQHLVLPFRKTILPRINRWFTADCGGGYFIEKMLKIMRFFDKIFLPLQRECIYKGKTERNNPLLHAFWTGFEFLKWNEFCIT